MITILAGTSYVPIPMMCRSGPALALRMAAYGSEGTKNMPFDESSIWEQVNAGHSCDWYKAAGKFVPIHIRAYLRSPVIADEWLPLDGLLLYQAHRFQAGGGPEVTVPGGHETNSVARLPLDTVRFGRRDWFYKSSWAQWPDHTVEGQDYWNKRVDSQWLDLVDFGNRRGKVVTRQGRYKSYHMPIFYRSALWIDWYCVGCIDSLRLLLPIVTHIGKKGSQGWGRVRKWVIEPWPEDWSVWCDGQLMRGVFERDVMELIQQHGKYRPFEIAHYGVRPSYYKKNNQYKLAVPA